jgi:hypothetical protein
LILKKIPEEGGKGKKKEIKRRKTQTALSDLDVNGKLSYLLFPPLLSPKH